VLGLHLEELRLLTNERRRLARNLGILNPSVVRHGCSECLRACQSLRSLYRRFFFIIAQNSAE
jgi:hypothetical protein